VASSKRIPVKEARNCRRRCKYVRDYVHVGAGARQFMNPWRSAAFKDLRWSATPWKHCCGANWRRAGSRSATGARRAGKHRRSCDRNKDRKPHEIYTPLASRGCQGLEDRSRTTPARSARLESGSGSSYGNYGPHQFGGFPEREPKSWEGATSAWWSRDLASAHPIQHRVPQCIVQQDRYQLSPRDRLFA